MSSYSSTGSLLKPATAVNFFADAEPVVKAERSQGECERNVVATASSATTTNPEINRRFMETPVGSKYRVWLTPPGYGQQLRSDVICFTITILFLAVSAGIACAARFNRASEDSAGRDSLERLHRVDLDQAVWDLTERPPRLLAAAIAIKFRIVN